MSNPRINPEDGPPGRFISLEEAEASARKWIEMNDELFRRLANDERFEQTLQETNRDYTKTMKKLADGDKSV